MFVHVSKFFSSLIDGSGPAARRIAVLWCLGAVLCGAWAGYRILTGAPLETNLLALLPTTERNPRAEQAVNVLAESLGNRAVFLVGDADAAAAHAAARRFATELRTAKAFRLVNDAAPRADASVLTTLYGPYRFGLLSTGDRSSLAAPGFDAEARLARRLHQPVRTGIATDLAADPYGLLQNWLGSLPLMQTRLMVEDGQMIVRGADATWVLILAELPGSAYDNAVQTATVDAVAGAEAALKRDWPQARLLRTGGVFYGAAARASAQGEMDLIGVGSLGGILLMLWLLFRSIRPMALGMLTVAIGIAFATAAVLATYGHLHLITLVFGASLIGEAVDYAIQVFAAQLGAGREWEPKAAIRRLFRPLAVALATSLIGYGALALTPFPAIGQIALFAFVGLAAAWISVFLLLPHLATKPLQRDAATATRWPRAFLEFWRRRITPRLALGIAAIAILVSLPGWLRLAADDDIRQLISRPPQLVAEETQIRELAGFSGSSRFFLVEGTDSEAALQREEALTARLAGAPGLSGYLALSGFVPSAARQADNHRLMTKALLDPPDAATARLTAAGFRDDIAVKWIADAAAGTPPLTLEHWLASPLATPWRHLALAGGGATLVIPQGDDGSANLAALAEGLP
ncbi:MAG: MMPL family transporter, partial [Betaproteobacteria bacterium]